MTAEVSRYIWPAVSFIEYADDGAILQHGSMAIGHVEDMQAKGGNWIIGSDPPPPNSRVNPVTKEVEPQPECPAIVDGLKLTNLPIPCRVFVMLNRYEVDDGEIEFEFVQSGEYDVTVQSATHLTGKYRLVKP